MKFDRFWRVKFDRFWRVYLTCGGVFYAVKAFESGLDNDRLLLFFFCMVAAIYLFVAAKSHSRVKAFNKRQDRP